MSIHRAWALVIAVGVLGPAATRADDTGLHVRRVDSCFCSVAEGEEARDCDARRGTSFAAWRRNAEILGFAVGESGRGSFMRTIANVTRDDDVYLAIHNADPGRYRVSVKVTVDADSSTESIGGLDEAVPFGDIQGPLGRLLEGTRAEQTATGQETENADAAEKAAHDQMNAAAWKMAAMQKKAEDAAKGKAPGAMKAAQDALEAARDAERHLVTLHDAARRLAAALGSAQGALDRAQAKLREGQLALARAAIVAEPVAAAVDVLWPKDASASPRAALDEATAALESANATLDAHPTLPGQAHWKTVVAERKTAVARLEGDLAGLDSQFRRAVAAEEARAARKQAETDACVYLGRFGAGDKVDVAMSVADATPPPDDGDTLKKAAQTAYDALGKVLAERKAAPAASPARAPAASPGPTPPPAPKQHDLLTYSFTVLRPLHFRTGAAFIVSWLKNPSYEVRTRTETTPAQAAVPATTTTAAVPATPEKKRTFYTLAEGGDTRTQTRPAYMASLNLVTEYPGATADSDPHEAVRQGRRYIPFLTFGIGLKDVGDDYFFGGGVSVGRSVQIVAGLHSGRVTRLLDRYRANVEFEAPLGVENLAESDVTVRRRVNGFFAGLVIDAKVVGKLFGGGADQ
jgi:hypothetical protein